ncbi:unnamed protein product [Amoebophrya sp. A25]|nr:unnamed protein product [Amoebophrya sp. A25]|eukprot:GSA25T00018032001.1
MLRRWCEKVIFVSLQFRAGTLGHAGSEGLKNVQVRATSGTRGQIGAAGASMSSTSSTSSSSGAEGSPFANFSLLDSRLALQWIQKHIHHFGGDRNKVVLFGQSSGACMATAHFVSPPSFGLFSSVIASSGGFNGWCTAPLEEVGEKQFRDLYEKAVELHQEEQETRLRRSQRRSVSPRRDLPSVASATSTTQQTTTTSSTKKASTTPYCLHPDRKFDRKQQRECMATWILTGKAPETHNNGDREHVQEDVGQLHVQEDVGQLHVQEDVALSVVDVEHQ